MADIIDITADPDDPRKRKVERSREDGLPPVVGETKDVEDAKSTRRKRPAATVVRLKLAGASFAEIAEVMEYDTPGHARMVFETAIASSGEQDVDYKMLRTIANAQLDGLMKSVASRALDPSDAEHLAYFRAALSIIDRKAKLNGLDAPVRLDIRTPNSTEFEAVLEEATRALGGGPVEPDIFELEQAPDGVTWQRSDDTDEAHLEADDDE